MYRIENAYDIHTLRRDEELLKEVLLIIENVSLSNPKDVPTMRKAVNHVKEVLRNYDDTFRVHTGEIQKRAKLQRERIERKSKVKGVPRASVVFLPQEGGKSH